LSHRSSPIAYRAVEGSSIEFRPTEPIDEWRAGNCHNPAVTELRPGTRHPQEFADQPAHRLLGIEDRVLDDGTITRVLRTNEASFELDGTLVAGVLCVLGDSVLGGAAVQAADPDKRMVTTNLHLDLTGLPRPEGEVTGRGKICAVTDDAVLVYADLASASGSLAHATARFAMLPVTSRAAGAVSSPVDRPVQASTKGSPEGNPIVGGSPIVDLLGLRVLSAGHNGATLSMLIHAELCNERGGLHGGIGALLGEQTSGLALRAVLPEGSAVRPLEVRVVFLRPIGMDPRPAICTASVVHAGRRFASTRSELFAPNGERSVLIDSTYAIHPAEGSQA
jgi:uncharacterized protein (TIGR00369 family)